MSIRVNIATVYVLACLTSYVSRSVSIFGQTIQARSQDFLWGVRISKTGTK